MNAPPPESPGGQPSVASTLSDVAARRPQPLNICIASPEFIGPSPDGAAGIAYTAMAQSLAAAGYNVTCLLLGARVPFSREWQRWVEKYRSDGLTLVALPQINASELVAPPNLIKSYEVYHWLKKNDRFDIIHFPERQGPGYHTLTAKHHGVAFARTTICVGLHSMTRLLQGADPKPVRAPAEVDTEFMERRAVALADALVSPDKNLVDWISERGREQPCRGVVQPDAPPRPAPPAPSPATPPLQEINELVFFGTLETSKGAILFCDALDSIPADIAQKLQAVTFLGKESIIDGVPALNYIRKRAQLWPFPYQFIADLHESATLDYLRRENRLAVIPTLRESSLYRVLECLVARIAFVASRVGGVTELIAPDDLGKVCFEPNAGSLCAILCGALTRGMAPARAAVDTRASEPAPNALRENSSARFDPASLRASAAWPARQPGLPDDAAKAAIQALSIDPNDAVALKVLARIYLKAGLNEAAEEACQLILKDDAEDAEALQMIEETRLAENIIDTTGRARREPGRPETRQTFAAGFTSPFACP